MKNYKNREYLTSEILNNLWYNKENLENPYIVDNIFLKDNIKFVSVKMLNLDDLENSSDEEIEELSIFNYDLFDNSHNDEMVISIDEFLSKFTLKTDY